MASITSAHQLLESEIKDLYSAEKQLIKAIPKLIAATNCTELKAGLSAHLDETRQQVVRLESIAGLLGVKASGKVCKGMEGIVQEGAEAVSTQAPPAVYDLGIIAAARRAEHYEMAGYMTAIELSKGLQFPEVTALLQETLLEEKRAEEALQRLVGAKVEASISGDGAPEHGASKGTRSVKARSA
jgi:ferritin-like metal-binding protein YciE